MKIPKKLFKIIIISSAGLGLIADKISVSDGHKNIFLGSWMGFTLFLPLSFLIALKIIELIQPKKTSSITTFKIVIPLIFAILVVGVMIFAFALYDLRAGPGSISDMYGLVYLMGFIPAIAIGLFYGLLIALNLKQ